LAPSIRNIGYQRAPVAPSHDQGSIDPMEIYETRICHIGTDNNSTTISSPLSLRTTLFLKGRAC
jgi:hypothetical protein